MAQRKKKDFFHSKMFIFLCVLVVVPLIIWSVYSKYNKSFSSVNLVAERPCIVRPTPCPPGVPCINDPALMGDISPEDSWCPDPTPEPRFCTQVAGNCIDKKGQCNTFTDGCRQNEICATPIKSCKIAIPKPSSIPIPPPGCYYEQYRCGAGERCLGGPTLICPTSPTPKPTQFCTQVVGTCIGKPTGGETSTCVSYKNGCEQADRCAKPIKSCDVAIPIPVPTTIPGPGCKPQVATISLSSVCSSNGYRNIQYSCVNGPVTTLSSEDTSCLDGIAAYNRASSECRKNCK